MIISKQNTEWQWKFENVYIIITERKSEINKLREKGDSIKELHFLLVTSWPCEHKDASSFENNLMLS